MKSENYYFLDPMITRVLRESPVPLQVLAICFKVNEISRRVIPLNAVKYRLKTLIEQNKIYAQSSIVTKGDKEKTAVFYWTRPIS